MLKTGMLSAYASCTDAVNSTMIAHRRLFIGTPSTSGIGFRLAQRKTETRNARSVRPCGESVNTVESVASSDSTPMKAKPKKPADVLGFANTLLDTPGFPLRRIQRC